jgi:hypothetical protein
MRRQRPVTLQRDFTLTGKFLKLAGIKPLKHCTRSRARILRNPVMRKNKRGLSGFAGRGRFLAV